ncbi:MAG: DPP IV N-terminal domain-containing protein [Acidobacteriia bacterium]|nr:DPP IV N-terminal domain-containing protein [Terriglobia bacterium]
MLARKLLLPALLLLISLPSLGVQDKPQIVIRPAPQEEMILALPDVQPLRSEQAAALAPALKTLNEVLWDDLKFSGFFTLAGKSFYPPQAILREADINYDAWGALPFRVSFLSAGTLQLDGGVLMAELNIYDMKQQLRSFGKRFTGDIDQARSIAHLWADEIVNRLTAGASRGIASTRIAYSSRRGGAKEIYVMDYDGNDQRPFTRNGSLNLFPSWAPDSSKLAFISYKTGKPEINIYSYLDGSRLPFPVFNSLTANPKISPDGSRLVFTMTDPRGNIDIYVSKLDGTDRRNLTNSPAINSTPTWSPSGSQIAFISNRDSTPQIYICDTDGANVRRIVKEGGEADWPAWSPDGRWIAFHWKPRMAESFDIYIAEVSTGQIRQLTSDSGSNECPSWAPDGRHLAFQSNRTGSDQIFIMLADTNNPELRMVTSQGANTCPAWGGYLRKN